jgi:hypothetical protein
MGKVEAADCNPEMVDNVFLCLAGRQVVETSDQGIHFLIPIVEVACHLAPT